MSAKLTALQPLTANQPIADGLRHLADDIENGALEVAPAICVVVLCRNEMEGQIDDPSAHRTWIDHRTFGSRQDILSVLGALRLCENSFD